MQIVPHLQVKFPNNLQLDHVFWNDFEGQL